jgi:uncharacterized glyoxalase superfamily protein PhnB
VIVAGANGRTSDRQPLLPTSTKESAVNSGNVGRAVPMLNVADVRATADWYRRIGFTVAATHEDEGDMNWALLTLGNSEVMLNAGGRPGTGERRDVDIYIHIADVDKLYQELKDQVEVLEEPVDRFYGSREFVIRDHSGFWVTFGERIRSR